jgi:hypothetical protein
MAQFNPTLPTFAQSLPGIAGADAVQNMLRTYLQNKSMRIQNQFAPEVNRATIDDMYAKTQGQNINNQFAPDTLAAKLRGLQIENQLAPEKMDLQRRRLDIYDKNSEFRDRLMEFQKQKSVAQFSNALKNWISTPAGAALASEQPEVMRNVLQAIENMSYATVQATGGADGLDGGFGYQQQQQMPPNMQMPPQYQPQMQQQMLPQGGAQMPPAMGQQPPMGQQQTPGMDDRISAAQDATASALEKRTSTNQILNQRQYAGLLVNQIENASKDMYTAINAYHGVGGMTKLKSDISRSKIDPGYAPARLIAYQKAVNVSSKIIANEITRSLGEAHNIPASEAMLKLAKPLGSSWFWLENPEVAIGNWDELYKTAKNTYKQLSQSLAQGKKKADKMNPNETLIEYMRSQDAQQNVPQNVSRGTGQGAGGSGMVVMTDKDGASYAVHQSDVAAAIQYGWRRANG